MGRMTCRSSYSSVQLLGWPGRLGGRLGLPCGPSSTTVHPETSESTGILALDHSQAIGDQTFYFSPEHLSETLFIGEPLQRLSSVPSERPQKNRRTFCDYNFHSCLRPWQGQRPKL